MKKKKSVADLLDDVELPPAYRSVVADNEPLADAILQFLQLKATGHPKALHLTLRWFYVNKLQQEFGGPNYFGTVRDYVRKILKLDIKTGNPL